ncbi:MAG TPA: prolipoprotein diacylglyceryl transferase family protein [Streptosporangiaceae bacterium]|nr:prolipoprotein diacylglyceryl transferase family protein [Streptosporangiaceae bacterium]
MAVAFLPSPVDGLWRVGPVVLDGYALCVVLGIAVAIWVAERRYRAVGGRPWLILDLATVVVPAALLGARLERVITNSRLYFGHGRDWVDILRIADGGLGLPGAVVAGLAAAWLWCRYTRTGIGPVLGAAAPGLVLAEAAGVWGNWFAQSLYGPPSSWPWAVEIAPSHRLPGYQSFGTFQPLFLYESVWDVLAWLLLIFMIRWLALTGARALVLCAGLYAVGRLGTQELRLGAARHSAPITLAQLVLLAAIAGAAAYLYATRARQGPEPLMAEPRRHRWWAPGTAPRLADDMEPGPNASRMAGGARPVRRPPDSGADQAAGGMPRDELAN